MKENYWMREELDNNDESFGRQHNLKQQDKRNSISHQQANNEQRDRHSKQNRAKNSPTINEPTKITTRNNNNNNNNNNKKKKNTISSRHANGELTYKDILEGKNDAKNLDNIETIGGQSEFLNDNISTPLNYREQSQVGAQQSPIRKEEKDGVNLSFCGCGFLGIYHVGVASCFHQYAPQLSMHKIAGSSAGALVAVAHICGNLQLAYATTDILRIAIDARARSLGPLHPSFDINAIVREALERGLPDDVHLIASGKLHISLTRVYDGENVVVSEFESKEDVIQALLCSCFIPVWSGLVMPKYKGISYMDGGFSKNLLILDNETITVSPFAGEADICPQDDSLGLLQISVSSTSFSVSPNNLYRLSHALLPPSPEVLSDLCEQGFADGIRFLQQMKLISCTKCLEVRSSLLVTVNGEDMEEAFTQQVISNESMKSTSSFSENHHIRLDRQKQKVIEINGSSQRRRNSVVSKTQSQIYHQTSSASTQLPYNHHEIRGHRQTFSNDPPTLLMDSPSSSPLVENCNECYLMRQKALFEPLPTQFSDRIRDACDAVNKSLSNWFYSYRPIKYLSYLAAPLYLPVDISLALIVKSWQELPLIRSELLNCVSNIVNFLMEILKRMHQRSTTSRLLMERYSDCWNDESERNTIEYEKEIIRLQQKSVSNGNKTNDTNNNDEDNDNEKANQQSCCCPPIAADNCHHKHEQQLTIITHYHRKIIKNQDKKFSSG